MKVVSLISGGKDGLFALNRAVLDFGHELIALAHVSSLDYDPITISSSETFEFTPDNPIEVNLEHQSQELDSWFYQSVGSEVSPFIAFCLDKPMYILPRSLELKNIIASLDCELDHLKAFGASFFKDPYDPNRSVDQDLLNLYILLLSVKLRHPEICGVVSGAILSNYQRCRIEVVCRALGLTSVAPLWELDQSKLLQSMIDAPIEAIIIKVASMGLDSSDLKKSIKTLQSKLEKISAKFGVNICGEGGEYETLVLNAPLFSGYRLGIEKYSTKVHSDSIYSPVAYTVFEKIKLIPKNIDNIYNKCDNNNNNNNDSIVINQNFNDSIKIDYYDFLSYLVKKQMLIVLDSNFVSIPRETSIPIPISFNNICILPNLKKSVIFKKIACPASNSLYFYASNSYGYGSWEKGTECLSITQSTQQVMASISKTLNHHEISLRDVGFVQIIISNMQNFGEMNTAYSQFLTPINNPPSRVTIAQTPSNSNSSSIRIQVWGWKGPNENRNVHHVESLSIWAPACIGSYSQIHAFDSMALDYFAGQIALEPMSMVLVNEILGLPIKKIPLPEFDSDKIVQNKSTFNSNKYELYQNLKNQLDITVGHVFSLLKYRKYTNMENFDLCLMDSAIYTCVDLELVKDIILQFISISEDEQKAYLLNISYLVHVSQLPRSALIEISAVASKNILTADSCFKSGNLKALIEENPGTWKNSDCEFDRGISDEIFCYEMIKFNSSETTSHIFVHIALSFPIEKISEEKLIKIIKDLILQKLKKYDLDQNSILSTLLLYQSNSKFDLSNIYLEESIIESIKVNQLGLLFKTKYPIVSIILMKLVAKTFLETD